MALPIQIHTHLLNLKVCHITETAAECALVGPRTAKREPLHQPPARKRLIGTADQLRQTGILDKNADNMRTARRPQQHLISFRLQMPAGINPKQFRVQRTLKKGEGQFTNCQVGLRNFHCFPAFLCKSLFVFLVLYQTRKSQIKAHINTEKWVCPAYRTKLLQVCTK